MSKGSRARPLSVTRKTFDSNWDRIFGKKDQDMQVKVNSPAFKGCGCGRSPTGKCIGWHAMNEQQLAEARAKWEEKVKKE
jgi:hypothetical protein